ncbi:MULTISPECIES: hypothetical protein [Vibrio]|nr:MULTISPECIES: hypothetical protein [Vibrio]
MKFITIEYKIMGIGNWISAQVSPEVAKQLATEYQGYGWPVKVS